MTERIEGERIVLRPITVEDTEYIVRWRNDADVKRRFVVRTPFTEEGHLRWLNEQVATGKVAQFMICEKEDLRPVGSVYLRDVDHTQSVAEYGVLIGEKNARGKGYGTEACALALRYAFHTLRLETVFLRVFTDNEAAIRSYERAGFQKVGVMQDVVATDGTVQDMYRMEARRDDEDAHASKTDGV